jgi:hypothetical protein
MRPNPEFIHQDNRFWAVVKLVSETVGYSQRSPKGEDPKMRRYDFSDVMKCHNKLEIPKALCFESDGSPTSLTKKVIEYLNYRGDVIENHIKYMLMKREEAKNEFEKLQKKFSESKVKIQMNKQKGEKRHPSYLVGLVNLIAESVLGSEFDNDPSNLGVIIDNGGPLFTLCRRMDGAYPSTFKPKLIWEIKEYYGTTTFGSRIADGVYETMLVGEELKQLLNNYDIKIYNVLFVDDYFTWWVLGRSYVCRLIDMLHIGYADAIFFGKEVLTEWEPLLKEITKLPS